MRLQVLKVSLEFQYKLKQTKNVLCFGNKTKLFCLSKRQNEIEIIENLFILSNYLVQWTGFDHPMIALIAES